MPVPNHQAKMKTPSNEEIQAMIQATRDDNGDVIAELPHDATNPAQEALKAKHGSPRSFAQKCVNAIGEISCLEAHAAIAKYRAEWDSLA
jgi:hypothetical protein